MNLNQVTVTLPDLDAGWRFYVGLGLEPIVDSRPDYARFACPDGGATFSLHRGEANGGGTTVYFECADLDARVAALSALGYAFAHGPADMPWLWREAELTDPGGNRVLLYFAGRNRLDPPWRVQKPPQA
ncbi:MAG TPA: VOC family protein [Caulobacteraceae bacterium]|nr:VOC family protein [Caulobacteraceae bacterium]